MRHLRAAGVPLLALALVASCDEEPPPPTEHYELTGRVIEDLDERPIAGAQVTFTSDTLYTSATTTDSSGIWPTTVIW